MTPSSGERLAPAIRVRQAPMRYFIHIVTDAERVIDPGGAEFLDLESARTEACQSARDLMAEELRSGRPVPLGWRIQVADEDGFVLFMRRFARFMFFDYMAIFGSRGRG